MIGLQLANDRGSRFVGNCDQALPLVRKELVGGAFRSVPIASWSLTMDCHSDRNRRKLERVRGPDFCYCSNCDAIPNRAVWEPMR